MASDPAGARFDHGIATLHEARDAGHVRLERTIRRTGLALMTLLVVAALSGLLGSRESTADAGSGPVGMTVDHVQITRPGIEAPLTVRVHRDGGFDGPVTLAFEAALFEKLDFQSWFPTPSAETADGRFVQYEFDTPSSGDTFSVHLDAHAQSTQWPSTRTYTVALVDDDHPVEVEFRMWVMP